MVLVGGIVYIRQMHMYILQGIEICVNCRCNHYTYADICIDILYIIPFFGKWENQEGTVI